MAHWLETLSVFFEGLTRRPIEAYIDLQDASEEFLVSSKGNLISFVELDGALSYVGSEELVKKSEILREGLTGPFKSQGHKVELCIAFIPGGSELEISATEKIWQRGCKNVGLDLSSVITAKSRVLKNRVIAERMYLVVSTELRSFPGVAAAYDRATGGTPAPKMKNGQKVHVELSEIEAKHLALVAAVVEKLKAAKIAASSLSAKEALQVVRGMLYPELALDNWRPVLAHDEYLPRRIYTPDVDDWSDLAPAPLVEQLLVHGGHDIDSGIFKLGSNYFAYVNMLQGPIPEKPFNELVQALNEARPIPWRINFALQSEPPAYLSNKRLLAQSFQRTNPINRQILDACERVEAWKRENIPVVQMSIAAVTWSPVDKGLGEINRRVAQLISALSGWGGMQVAADTQDPALGLCGTVPGVRYEPSATKAVLPLRRALAMSPISRPGGPWEEGTMIFHTADGKPFLYSPLTELQDVAVTLIAGGQGSGKSSMSNAQNLAALASFADRDGNRTLPQIGIIDVGPSSRGLIDTLRFGLPASRQTEVQYVRWRNSKDYATNPFETPLGLRTPLASQLDSLISLVEAMLSISASRYGKDARGLLTEAIHEAYRYCADETTAKKYQPALSVTVDKAIETIGFAVDDDVTWWELVDAFFSEGWIAAAMEAQRFAVPILMDLARIFTDQRIFASYGNIGGSDGLIGEMNRALSDAVKNFSILSGVTKFDLKNARVVALDLHEVVQGKGDSAKKRQEVFYLAARQLLGGELFQLPDDFEDAGIYSEYHKKRLAENGSARKRLVYEEFHLCKDLPGVVAQVVDDVRLIRKYNTEVVLVSQLIDDFSDELLQLASSVFVMSAPSETGINRVQEKLGLDDDTIDNMRIRLHGPTGDGAPFFGLFITKKGTFKHFLVSSLSAEELWALTTTPDDVEVKNRLIEAVGYSAALTLLCSTFPNGSAVREINLIRNRSGASVSVARARHLLVDRLIKKAA